MVDLVEIALRPLKLLPLRQQILNTSYFCPYLSCYAYLCGLRAELLRVLKVLPRANRAVQRLLHVLLDLTLILGHFVLDASSGRVARNRI